MNFKGLLGDSNTIWYPTSGWCADGVKIEFPNCGNAWSVTPSQTDARLAQNFGFNYLSDIFPMGEYDRGISIAVRCCKE